MSETDRGKDETEIDYVVSESDLYGVYSLLADATGAAAAGDRNECASKASNAKEKLLDIHNEGTPLHEVDDAD